jgi:hypothetical protein
MRHNWVAHVCTGHRSPDGGDVSSSARRVFRGGGVGSSGRNKESINISISTTGISISISIIVIIIVVVVIIIIIIVITMGSLHSKKSKEQDVHGCITYQTMLTCVIMGRSICDIICFQLLG